MIRFYLRVWVQAIKKSLSRPSSGVQRKGASASNFSKKKTGFPLTRAAPRESGSCCPTSATWLSRTFRTRGFPPPDYSEFGFIGFFFLVYTLSEFFARKKFHPTFPGGKLGLQFFFQRARDPDDSAFSVDEGMEGRTRDQVDCIGLS